jgi:hypothetical protein
VRVRIEIEFHRPKTLAGRSPETGTGTAAPAKDFPDERRPAGGQYANRVPTKSGRGPRVSVAQASSSV